MARRLILDTGVLIASERHRIELTEGVEDDDDIVIATLTVAELRTGIELATDRHRARRSAFVARVLQALPVEPYDAKTAEAHATLLAHVHRSGITRGAHDLIIAATALTTARTILTTDRRARFAELPGIHSITVP